MKTSTHEDLRRKVRVAGSSDRSFAVLFCIVLTLLGLRPLLRGHPVRWWLIALGVLFLVVGVIRPILLRPLNRAWTFLGILLGKVVNPIVTALAFLVVFTPVAILLRILKRDALRLRYEKSADTYWIRRDSPGPAPESLRNQF